MKKHLSNRKFLLSWIEGEDQCKSTIYFDTLFSDNHPKGEYEYIYALQDRLDEVLDLKIGETIPFQFNRDNPDSQGVIKRIE